MRKFHKFVSILTLLCFYFSTNPVHAALSPLSLSQMYGYASSGNVRALRSAVQRGMNIDTTDRNGNTGLCYAILKKDILAYNAFRSAGANPSHSCTQNIPDREYSAFMNSSKVAGVNESPRAAYGYFNKGEYVISKKTWAAGALLLIAGGAALALGGGGGGGGGSKGGSGGYVATDDSLAGFAGTLKPNAAPSGHKTVLVTASGGSTQTNSAILTLGNDYGTFDKTGSPKLIKELLDFSGNILEYSKYMQVGMKAFPDSVVINNSTIFVKDATAGMAALGANANASNLSTIQINAENGAIGMIAGEKATATNYQDIFMSFAGSEAQQQVIGMYADTGATIKNVGKIESTSVGNTANSGTLIGMEGRLINQETSPSSVDATKVINETGADIKLSISTTNETTSTNVIGMGSFLDRDFLNGAKLVARAGFVEILNSGNIVLNAALNGLSTYTQSIRLNNGGIIGILADANTKATNSRNITVKVEANDDDKFTGSHAGMLSLHGGEITNSGNINVTGGTNGYGMIGLRGIGANAEFDTRKPTLLNSGIINISSIQGFGMISLHGGSVKNTSEINLNKIGVGIHSNAGTIENSGDITLDESGSGITVIKNAPGEGSSNYDTQNTTVTNSGTIEIKKAVEAYGIYAEYGKIVNEFNSEINLSNSASTDVGSYGIFSIDGSVINNGKININIKNTISSDPNANDVTFGIGSQTSKITNSATGEITFTHDGVGMASISGEISNAGKITLNGGGTGILSDTGKVENTGDITLNSNGTGISTITGTVINKKKITIDGHESVGIYSSGNVTNDTGANIYVKGKNGTGINVGDSGKVLNKGTIEIVGDVDGIGYYGIKADDTSVTEINNEGTIKLTGNGSYDSSVNKGYGISIANGIINNRGTININGLYGYGINIAGGIAKNYSGITLLNAGYGMMGGKNSSLVNEKTTGIIHITGTELDDESYGMHTAGGTARNDGTITIDDFDSVGIHATNSDSNAGHGINVGTINMNKDRSVGLSASGAGSTLRNIAGATINILGDNSTGILLEEGTVTNEGSIDLKADEGVGVILVLGEAKNTGTITGTGTGSNIGMFTFGGALTNLGTINLVNGIGMHASSDGVTTPGAATNNKTITITGTSANNVGMKATDGATVTNSGSNAAINMVNGIGMSASGATSIAKNDAKITMTGTGNTNYGMRALNDARIYNNGSISISGGFGMHGEGVDSEMYNNGKIASTVNGVIGMHSSSGIVYNNGEINLSGTNNIGMRVSGADGIGINNGSIILGGGTGMYAENGATIFNNVNGSIQIGAATSVGMYATGAGSKIYNLGRITIDGVACTGAGCTTGTNHIKIANGATYEAGGLTFSGYAMNFNSFTADDLSKVVVAKGGTFEAPELSGKIYAGSSIVEEGFGKKYVNKNSFVGEDTGIDLLSNSYLFNASLVENEKGSSDIVMKMKDFSEVVSDNEMADYLSTNYDRENVERLFTMLKRANNKNSFSTILNNQLGLDFFPSFAKQNLEVIKSLNRKINNSIFLNEDPKEITTMVGYDFVKKDQEKSGAVEGYEEEANSVYGLIERKYNNNLSYGAGITITQINSKYDNKSKRTESMINLLAPIKYKTNEYTFVSTPRIGYGWGDYRRNSFGTIYKANTSNYYYGVANEVRKDIDLSLFILEPTAELNLLGVYQDRTKEKSQISVKATNNLSMEAGVGLYAKKAFEIDENNSIKVRVGGTFYQEFGDYKNSTATMSGASGSYNMKGYEADRSRGIISARADYTHKSVNFFTEAGKTIERDNSYELQAGVSFNF